MKIWEKYFLLTFTLFFMILNIGFAAWFVLDMKSNYGKFAEKCVEESNSIALMRNDIKSGKIDEMYIDKVAAMYKEKDTYIKIYEDTEVVTDTFLTDIPDTFFMGVKEIEGKDYYYINTMDDGWRIAYAKSLNEVYDYVEKIIAWILAIDIIIGILMGLFIYKAMKGIYRPVSDISHELRTPLTSVMGYAQLLMIDTISEEEKREAAMRIDNEAQYMRNVVEKLLTLDSIRGNKVAKGKIFFEGIVEKLQEKYPEVHFENDIIYIKGEETLVKILLENLMDNAVREDSEAHFYARDGVIKIVNRAENITAEDVKLINNRKGLSQAKIKGKGLGVEISMEIIKSLGWGLGFTLMDGKLNTIITIPNSDKLS